MTDAFEEAVQILIERLGDDPDRAGLQDTPRRYIKFLDEMRERANGSWEPTAFPSKVNNMLVVRDIPLYSLCEHHMLPWFGFAHVGYIPRDQILGLSKIARVVAQRSSGLTVQEELSAAVAEDVRTYSGSPDVAVVTTGTHTCMLMRGIQAHGSSTVASAMLGAFIDSPAARMEFLQFVEGRR